MQTISNHALNTLLLEELGDKGKRNLFLSDTFQFFYHMHMSTQLKLMNYMFKRIYSCFL